MNKSMAIVCKSAAEIEKMRRSGGIVRQVLDHVRTLVVPGATTMDLERAAEQKIKDLGVKPAFKAIRKFLMKMQRGRAANLLAVMDRSLRGFSRSSDL